MKSRMIKRTAEMIAAIRRSGIIRRFGIHARMSQPPPRTKKVCSFVANPANAILWSKYRKFPMMTDMGKTSRTGHSPPLMLRKDNSSRV
jgi:hypothetical protein